MHDKLRFFGQTHPYISTGLSENKFGIELETAEQIYLDYKDDPVIQWKGVDCHIGSQLTDLSPMKDAFQIILNLVDRLSAAGMISYFACCKNALI